MTPTLRNRCRIAAALCLAPSIGLASPSGDSAVPIAVEPLARASYAAPPSPGDTIVAVRDTVACDSERGARFTAETGFFAADCRPAVPGERWRVIACRHVDLADGGLWLVEVRAPDERGGAVWIPLPWHDWA